MKEYHGKLDAKGLRFAVILPRFNDFIGQKLLEGCVDAIKRHNGNEDDISLFRVPGAFEIPQTARLLLKNGSYDVIIALGAVIRGSTYHFDIVANEAAKGIAKLSLDYDTPIIFGILTTDTIEQAIERAGTKSGNKGFDAAAAGIELANLKKEILKLSKKPR